MIKKSLLVALLIFLTLLSSCKHNPTAPELVLGSRDYVWQLDTLDMPMNYIESVWGASPNDVWAVGAGGTESDRLLHYDGAKWSTYNKEIIWCTGNTLFGFSANDVWMGGGGGWVSKGAAIWHYDGVKWSPNYINDIDGAWSIQVVDIWGTNPNDLYASGVISFFDGKTDDFRGFVLHFDGKSWQEVVRVGPLNSQFLRIRKERNKLYVLSFRNGIISNDTDAFEFYQVIGEELREIYSTPGLANLNIIDKKVYFVVGESVYRHSDGSLVKQFSFDDPQLNFKVYGIHGRNEIDVFVSMKEGIAHYNGEDTQYLYKFPVAQMGGINEPIIFDKEVFFCIRNPAGGASAYNLMLHGKLKE